MLRQGGAGIISGVALQASCLRAGAAIAALAGCPTAPVGVSSASPGSPTACCAAAHTSACSCHTPGCSCTTCAATSYSANRAAVPACCSQSSLSYAGASHDTSHSRGGQWPLPLSISAAFPFSVRAFHISAAASLAAAAPSPAAPDADVERGRRSRRPQAATDSTLGAARGRVASDLNEEDGDEEVQAVLSKLVGGLTKSGRKATARRIVEDALGAVRRHLKKGGVEELK